MQGPLLPFAEGVLAAGYRLVICGFRVGGAKAQHATLRLLEALRPSPQALVPDKRVVCITFGAPQVLRPKVHT